MASIIKRALDPEAYDFAPDLLAIQERPPARLPRVVLLCTCFLMLVALAWAYFAQVDIVAVAEGRLVPQSFTKVVQPAEAGVVKEILVREGERVRKGQALVLLDARLNEADAAGLDKDVALKTLTLKRIDAELAGRDLVVPNGLSREIVQQVDAHFRARRQAYLDSVALERETRNKAANDLDAAMQIRNKVQQTLPTFRKSAEIFTKVQKEGFVGEIAANEKTREALEKEQDLRAQEATVQGLKTSIVQIDRRIASITSQYRSALENERLEVSTTLNRSSQELQKVKVRETMLTVRAPYDGLVKDLATTTAGAVVGAGNLLMNIVPVNEPLQAEVMLKNDDAGFVVQGQAAKVKVSAFPFQKYGMLEGEVELVAADSQEPNKQPVPGVTPLAYRAIVKLKNRVMPNQKQGDSLILAPGMLISAEIHQGKRSVLEYLLSPVQKVTNEAACER